VSPMLTRIDELTRNDHHHLIASDECYFLGEYTARRGFAYSRTNQLIVNLKKPLDRRSRPEWRYKENAICEIARQFREAIDEAWFNGVTLVPVPPSKTKADLLYDDRMLQVIKRLTDGMNADVRELVVQTKSMAAAHKTDDRPTPDELARNFEVLEERCEPHPTVIAIIDDVLTTGAHFKAMQMVLTRRFPRVATIGLFAARRVLHADDFDP